MNENYESDVKLNENTEGTVSFAPEVIATIAGLAATEIEGVAGMNSQNGSLADMFSRKNTRNFTKGVRIDLNDNKVTVDISITIDYGSLVPEVAKNIQENVKKAIETMSGLAVNRVDVHVIGISFEKEQRANAELEAQQRMMLQKQEPTTEESETRTEQREAAEDRYEETDASEEKPEEGKDAVEADAQESE